MIGVRRISNTQADSGFIIANPPFASQRMGHPPAAHHRLPHLQRRWATHHTLITYPAQAGIQRVDGRGPLPGVQWFMLRVAIRRTSIKADARMTLPTIRTHRAVCTTSSNSTAALSGNSDTPTAVRACRPASPKTLTSKSLAPLATFG